MRSKRSRVCVRIVTMLVVALATVGGPPARASEQGTLQPPYESASQSCSAVACVAIAAADGNVLAETHAEAARGVSMTSSGKATVVAAHRIGASAASVLYTANFRFSRGSVEGSTSSDDYSWAAAEAELSLTAVAEHDACGSCSGYGHWFIGWPYYGPYQLAPGVVVPVRLRMSNHAGGMVPPGTVRISVSLAAEAGASAYVDQQCSTCGLSSFPTASASARGEGQLASIDYRIETTPNQPPVASFTFSCAGRDCQFDGSGSTDPDGQVASYAWNFGDGTASGFQSWPLVEHRYPEGSGSYVAVLTVTDDRGGTDTESQTVTPEAPNQPPTARFSVSCVKTDCAFAGGASSDPDGQITGYSWDFGDGTGSQAGPSVQHRYPESSASYVAILIVTDDRGGTDTKSLTVSCTRKNQTKPTACS